MKEVEQLEKEMNDVFDKKVSEKIKKMKNEENEEKQKINRQKQDLKLEKYELQSLKEQYEKEKYDFEHSLNFHTNSLGRRKKYNFSMGRLKFGRQWNKSYLNVLFVSCSSGKIGKVPSHTRVLWFFTVQLAARLA